MRYYESVYPKVGDLVMVQLSSITDVGVYVALLEYDQIEGMIALSEMTNRRSQPRNMRVGRIEVAVVLHVDEEKGYIDLSKKKVTTEEIVVCETRFNKAKTLHNMMSRVADICREKEELKDWTLERLSSEILWPLYSKYAHAYDVLRDKAPDLPLALQIVLQENVYKRLQKQEVKIRADIDVMCWSYGIDAIKEAILHGKSTDPDVKIMLKKSPSYMITLTTVDSVKGIERVKAVCDEISRRISELGGTSMIQREPEEGGENLTGLVGDSDEEEGDSDEDA
jgi:translation initiation factor 2 subunit 1